MRSRFVPVVFLGLAITIVTIVFLKGGKSMFPSHKDSEAGIGMPPSDMPHSNTFETATFALG
ncbi:MAG: hypothetical protein ACHQ0Y_00995 [Thermodesulfovibrionales bacterium]